MNIDFLPGLFRQLEMRPHLLKVAVILTALCTVWSIDLDLFPYTHRNHRGMAKVAQLDVKDTVREIHGGFWALQKKLYGKVLYIPSGELLEQGNPMGFKFEYYLQYLAGFELIVQDGVAYQRQDGELAMSIDIPRVYKKPFEIYYSKSATHYVLERGDVIRVYPVEAP